MPGLRARIDLNEARSDIFEDYIDLIERLRERIPELMSHQGKRRGIRVENLKFELPDRLVNPTMERDAKEQNGSYSFPVRGDMVVTDKYGKETDRLPGKLLFRLPFPTGRGTFIIDGSEIASRIQSRLAPGVYVSKKANGVQAFINSRTKQNIKINFNPSTLKMNFNIGSRSFPAYSVLKVAGVPEEAIKRAWGDKVYAANHKAPRTLSRNVNKLYDTMLSYTGTAHDYREREKQIREAFEKTELDPWVSKVTLGHAYPAANQHALLAATKKMLDVNAGTAEEDNSDSTYFQETYGFNDLIMYGLENKARTIKSKLRYRVDNPKYSPAEALARPLAEVRGLVRGKFAQADLTYNPEQVNPIGILSNASEVTQMGEGGVGSSYSITESMRALNDSSMGIFDPIHTPTTDKVGVNMHLAANARKVGRQLKQEVYDFNKGMSSDNAVAISARDAYDSFMALPGQFDLRQGKFFPKKSKIRAIHKGKMVTVSPERIDYYPGSQANTLDWASMLIPFFNFNTPTRSSMAVKQSTHAQMLAEPESPLVLSGVGKRKDGSDVIAEELVAKRFSRQVPSYLGKSSVISASKQKIILQDVNSGKKTTIDLYNDFPLNGGAMLNEEPVVKPGDVVNSGDLLTRNGFINNGKLAMGKNLRVAYTPFRGWNFKDGIPISASAAKKLSSVHVDVHETSQRKHDIFSRKKFLSQFPKEYTKAQLENINDEGVVKPGTVLNQGDPLILKLTPRKLSQEDILRGNVSQVLKSPLIRDDKTWDSEHSGVVQKVVKTPHGYKVYVKSVRPVRVGDKLSNRHQAKGVVAAIIPDEEMPHTADGKPFDVIQSPAAVGSRINPGQILETAAGKLAERTGNPYVARMFDEKEGVQNLVSQMKRYGLRSKEEIYDSEGKPYRDGPNPIRVLTGIQYFTRQKQEAEPYFNMRNREDPYDVMSNRPIKGPKLGALGYYALLSHGATANLQEMATVKSEQNDEYWRAVESGEDIPAPKTTFAFNKLTSLLQGAGINLRREGNSYRVLPLTDSDVDGLSSGEVANPAMATRIGRPGKYDMLQPYEGGLYDTKLFGGLDGNKWGHITLAEPIPNPVYEQPIRHLLGMTQKQFDGVLGGAMGVKDGQIVERKPGDSDGVLTGGTAFKALLDGINVPEEIKRVSAAVDTHSGSEKDRLIKKLRYLGALQETNLSPTQAYLMSKVPVIPPRFRPVYLTKEGDVRVSDLTLLYQDLGTINGTMGEGGKDLPDGVRSELRNGVYNAVKSLQVGTTGKGMGTQQRKGILQFLKGDSATHGHFHEKIFGKRQSVGGRAVILPNPSLGIDEVGIPEDSAWKLFKSYVQRRLVKQGIEPIDARKMVETRKPLAEAALLAELKYRPIMMSRDPKLHKHNVLAFFGTIVPGKSFELSPLTTRGFNADFDGDQMGMTVPSGPRAVQEARTKLLPSQNLFKAGRDQVMMVPEEDTVASLYYATKFTNPTKGIKFSTPRQLMDAYENNDIALNDEVMLGKDKTTAGRFLVQRALPEGYKMKPGEVMTDGKIKETLNRIARENPGEYIDTLQTLNDLGNEFGQRVGLSFGLEDFMPVSKEELAKITPDSGVSESQKQNIIDRIRNSMDPRNALTVLADSGAKGDWNKLQQIKYSPILTSDFKGTVPHVIQRGYADGLSYEDYWAAAKGNRPALYSKSIEVREPGYFSKQLLRASLGNTVQPGDAAPRGGLEYSIDHPTVMHRYLASDLVGRNGSVIAQAGDAITDEIVASAKAQGVKTVKVRSPLTTSSPYGLYAKDFGRMPTGNRPDVGADIGVISAHTLTEPATQLTLKAFHDAGSAMASNKIKGLYAIWPLLNGRAPSGSRATLSPYAGKVTNLSKLRSGGYDVTLNDGRSFMVPEGDPSIKAGDELQRGQQVSSGFADPNDVLKYKGLRAMQMYLVDSLENTYGKRAPDRRYLEAVVGSLTRYAKITNPGSRKDLMNGDVVDLHEVQSYNDNLEEEQPPVKFKPVFTGMDQGLAKNEPDWAVKMLGRDMIRQLQQSAALGLTSDLRSPKPVLPFLEGTSFGEDLDESGLY